MTTAPIQSGVPRRMADETTWDLLRDEWELLMAIGSGPTPIGLVASRLGEPVGAIQTRVVLLRDHGLVASESQGYGLVPMVHERQEGMASYLRDLLFKRVAFDGPPPLGAALCVGTGDQDGLPGLHSQTEAGLLSPIVALASEPDHPESQRFVAVYAATTRVGDVATDGELVPTILQVLRGAAIERASDQASPAKMWVAEMSVHADLAARFAEMMESWVADVDPATFGGAIVAGLWPALTEDARTEVAS